MSTFRLLMYALHPAIGPLARFPADRVALLTGLRSQPWLASEVEARALREGFGECEDFWRDLSVPAWCGPRAPVRRSRQHLTVSAPDLRLVRQTTRRAVALRIG
jgi:hypothetical protein